MDIELRHFLLVVEHGTVTEAARRAHLTQPALSASIKRLEEQLGARLLDRGRSGARPTAAGRALLPHARAALAAVEDGRRAVAEVVGLRAGEVRLGAGPTACTYLLPPSLLRFRRAHPGIRLLLKEAHSPEVWDALQAGELDLGIVSDVSLEGQGTWFEAEPFVCDSLIVTQGPGPPRHAWVTFPRGSALRRQLERAFPDPDVVMELGSIAAVKSNVREGMGRCLISRAAVLAELADGRLIETPTAVTPIFRTFLLVHRGRERLPPAAARLRELLLGD